MGTKTKTGSLRPTHEWLKGPRKNNSPCWGVVLMPRPANVRREEGAYRPYSTDEQRRQTGCLGGPAGEVILVRALSAEDARWRH